MVDDLLRAFEAAARPGPFSAPFIHHSPGSGAHQRHVVLGFAIHGNEHGTLPAALRLQAELNDGQLAHGGPLSLLIGNPEAIRADERFLDEDFNRVFTFDRPAVSRERKRAEQVRPLLDTADLFLDFHQTQTPTEKPFWTFPWQTELGDWARALAAAPVGLTRKAGEAFSPGTCCLDEYVRARGRTGLTLEVGLRGASAEQADATYRTARRLLTLLDLIEARLATLESCALREAPLTWYVSTHVVRAETHEYRLLPGFQNWSEVTHGDILSPEGAPLLTAPASGVVMFPKYPPHGLPPPPELLRIAEKIADPTTLASDV